MKQKDAVYNAIIGVFNEKGVGFEDGMNAAELLTPDMKASVRGILVEGFKNKVVELDATYEEAELNAYCSGLLSNWLRKDKRLNGGVQYTAKNPGSRSGSGDATVVAIRQLMRTLTPGTDDYTEAQHHLDKRLAEIGAAKVKTISINIEALPEALRLKFTK